MPSYVFLISGGSFALILAFFGVKLRYCRAHGLIAGYNTATAKERARYDIQGLSHHLGNGLMTLGVLVGLAAVAATLESIAWCLGFMGLFVFVAALIVIGGRKFLPDPPQPGEHRILRALLPERAFEALRDGTREWLMECSCGHKADLWSVGGVRFKATGEPRQWTGCAACGKITWQKVRKKTPAEREQVA